MKKFFLGAGMLMMMLCAGFESKAIGIKIFGIEINYVRGMKVYHPERQRSDCEMRGMCEFTGKANTGPNTIKTNLGKTDQGKVIIVITPETAKAFPGDFTAGSTYPMEEIFLPANLTRELGLLNGLQIKKGEYPVAFDKASGRYFIEL